MYQLTDGLLSDEIKAARDTVARFMKITVAPELDAYEARGELPRDLIAKAGALGLYGSIFPEWAGGTGMGYLAAAVITEEMTRHDPRFASATNQQGGTCPLCIFAAGTDDHVREFIPAVPAKNLKELIALSHTRDVTIASSGIGGLPHLGVEGFKTASKGEFRYIPHQGGSPAVMSTMGGHTDAVVMDLPALYEQIKDGKLRAIAITADKRSEFRPDVPSSAEQGYPSFVMVNWFGVFAPAKTPQPVVDKLYAALVKLANSPEVKSQFAGISVSSSTMSSPGDFASFLAKESVAWSKIAKDSGVRAQ
jgi:hypothetical protein